MRCIPSEIFSFPIATLLYIWPSKRKHDDGSNSDNTNFVFLLPCICTTGLVEALKNSDWLLLSIGLVRVEGEWSNGQWQGLSNMWRLDPDG
ncbi:hypothetical protein GQ55_2G184400 [Panicum hallii var. hallii]|uniref:Uncharacterized protein n=1 Tax=Panicum hallii var. hallii TaxID=1504633 RepID=A0A2T7EQB1_9POAL|nr:hypothetical protein GQ55_2G184400 [Panicum hallii var. hallii]